MTVSCAEGDTGFIYDGLLETEVTEVQRGVSARDRHQDHDERATRSRLDFAQLPNAGVGLARLEFIINNNIGVHPKAIPDRNSAVDVTRAKAVEAGGAWPCQPARLTSTRSLRAGIIAAAFWPEVRHRSGLSDFKSNEYRKLIGRQPLRARSEETRCWLHGAARYISQRDFGEAFAMECEGAPGACATKWD